MNLYHTTDMDGVSMMNPDKKSMRELLAMLDEPESLDEEMPDVSLIHDPSGWSVSVFPSGIVTLENLEDEDVAPLYMNAISRDAALEMWLELSRGEIERVRDRPWQRDSD